MSQGRWLDANQKHKVISDIRAGYTLTETARRNHLSYTTIKRIKDDMRLDMSGGYVQDVTAQGIPPPLEENSLGPEASKALGDFDYFRRRYFGHISTPWQIQTANQVVELLENPSKEYLVENMPPGSGKSTMAVDLAAWLICRDRGIRGLFGSRVMSNAQRTLLRLRRALERTHPYQAKDNELKLGIACDAESTLSRDFGRFQPERAEVWRADSFVVLQRDDIPVSEKEPTWSAYGVDSGVLGNRFECILWDDLVDRRNTRNIETIQALQKLWDEELETRLEPGGLLVLLGQRMSPNDLYRYCLNKKRDPESEEEEAQGDVPMYRHILYKAHHEEMCIGPKGHGKDAQPYPKGCLLDPYRLPWRELSQINKNSPDRFQTLYQQEDTDPSATLVDPVWITGGTDRDGVQVPGCWDNDRGIAELPKGLVPPVLSIVTADPSPSKFWAVMWICYHPASEQRFVMDIVRQTMTANDFLDWNYAENRFSGLLEEWYQRSLDIGLPIRDVIVEANAAQRFLLQFDHAKRWSASRGINIRGHETHRNKSDPKLGVESIAPHFKFGRVRLPGERWAREASLKLVDEVQRYPFGMTDDVVMAYWFLEWNLPRLWTPMAQKPLQFKRPSWIRRDRYAS